ncbi:MAG: hypothetical protein HQ519_09620 [Planctomycetes bacterium]|nr:hypothetical protein [Planctomycetota bacterium]
MAKRSKMFDLIIGSAVLSGISLLAIPSPNTEEADSSPSPSLSYSDLNSTDPDLPKGIEGLTNTHADLAQSMEWGRDPFQKPLPVSIPEPEIVVEAEPEAEIVHLGPPDDLPRLNGISQVGERRMAILDREIVGVGDLMTSGFKITKLNGDSVVLQRDSREFTLTLRNKQ